MDKFWQLVEESTIFQGILVLLVVGTYCYLIATGQEVPKELLDIIMVIVGFFFGSKVQVAATKMSKKKK